MGHNLDAATMATLAISAYRHARRVLISLAEQYGLMDEAISQQFGPDHFVTAQLMHLNIATGELQLVNAGHPAPLLIRDHLVVRGLESATTLPIGFGGAHRRSASEQLQPGDRVLFFTDGIIEEHLAGRGAVRPGALCQFRGARRRRRRQRAGGGPGPVARPDASPRRGDH